MLRKKALVTAMLGALASQAHALGLGDIEILSALNQPLNAEIRLLSATPTELDELRVMLADQVAFSRAGLDRSYLLTKLKFDVQRGADGNGLIKVTTREPVREPFLDFLVQATWSSGQILREYTVLIDPPVLMPAAPPATRAPVVSQPAVTAAPSYTPPPAPAPTYTAPRFTGTEYGPTQRSDTLWGIASKVRPDTGVSMEQTMLGLLRANPEAFYQNNINNLKAGYVLRVPSREEFTSITASQALGEVRAQNQNWRDGTSSAAVATAADAPASTGGQLKLTSPDSGRDVASAAASDGASVAEVQRELTLALEEVESKGQENQELSARLADLEKQLEDMKRFIELKDAELARVQAAAAEAGADLPDTAVEAPVDEAETVAEEAEVAPADTGEAMQEGAQEKPLLDGQEVYSDPADWLIPGQEEPAKPAVTEPPAVDEEAEPPKPAVVETPAAPAETGLPAWIPPAIADKIPAWLRNPMTLLAVGGGALVVLLLGWAGARRRRMADTAFQESILRDSPALRQRLDGEEPVAAAAAAATAATAAAAAAPAAEEATPEPTPEPPQSSATEESDSSLFTDFAVSDMGALQNEAEADPLAEADVYLAYGRYQQAEDLVKGAVEKHPDREDFRIKLLEIYSAAQNREGFDAQAQRFLADFPDQQSDNWRRIEEMGSALNPDNHLYQGGGLAALDAAASFVAGEATAEPVAGEGEDNVLDFDIGAEDTADTVAEAVEDIAEADDNSIEFSLDEAESLLEDAGSELDTEGHSAVLDEGLGALDELGGELAESTESEEDGAFELESFELDSSEPVVEEEVPSFEADFDLDSESTDTTGEDAGLSLDEGLAADLSTDDGEEGMLANMDEVATKLDLARAYIDMGDPDGARSILGEVLEEGNAEQKAEAEGLMSQLS